MRGLVCFSLCFGVCLCIIGPPQVGFEQHIAVNEHRGNGFMTVDGDEYTSIATKQQQQQIDSSRNDRTWQQNPGDHGGGGPTVRGRNYLIGVILESYQVQSLTRAINIAVNEINSNQLMNGNTLSVTFLDANCDTGSGISMAHSMVASGVFAVIGGGCSQMTNGVYSVLNATGIPQLGISSTASIFKSTNLYPRFRQVGYTDDLTAAAYLALIQYYGWQKIGIVYANELYGQGLATALQAQCMNASIAVGSFLSFDTNAAVDAIRPVFQSLVAARVRVVIISALPTDTQNALLAADLENAIGLGYAYIMPSLSRALVATSAVVDDRLRQIQGVALGSLGLVYKFVQSVEYTKFAASYSNGYSGTMNDWAPIAYDAVYAVAYGINNALKANLPLTGDNFVQSLSDFVGASGELYFNDPDASSSSALMNYDILNFRLDDAVTIGGFAYGRITMMRAAYFQGDMPTAKVYRLGYVYRGTNMNTLYGGQLAVADLNNNEFLGAGDSISIDGLVRVTTCDVVGGQKFGREFVQANVTAIIGGYCSDDSLGLLSVTQAAAIPAVSYGSTLSGLASPDNYPYFVRTIHSDDLVNYVNGGLVNSFGWRRIGLFATNDSFAGGGAATTTKILASIGASLVANERWLRGTKPESLVPMVSLIAQLQISVIFLICHQDSFEFFMTAMAQAQIPVGSITIVLGNPSVILPSLNASTGFAAGIVGALDRLINTTTRWDFMQRYASTFASSPQVDPSNVFAAASYDAVTAVATAIKATKNQRQPVSGMFLMQNLRAVSFNGTSGPIYWKNGSNDLFPLDTNAYYVMNAVPVNNKVTSIQFVVVGTTGTDTSIPPKMSSLVYFGQGFDSCPASCMNGTSIVHTAISNCWNCYPCPFGMKSAPIGQGCIACNANEVCPLGSPYGVIYDDVTDFSPRFVLRILPTNSMFGQNRSQEILKTFAITMALVGLAILVLGFALIRYGQQFQFWPSFKYLSKEFDFFSRDHVSPHGMPLFMRKTVLGGVLSFLFTVLASLLLLYLLVMFFKDRLALDTVNTPGISNFFPDDTAKHVEFNLRVQLMDNLRSCDQACRFDNSIVVGGKIIANKSQCYSDSATNDCMLHYILYPGAITDRSFPASASLTFLFFNARAYSYQWNVTTTWMNVQYYVSGNTTVTDIDPNAIFMGPILTQVNVQFRPTRYTYISGTSVSGYTLHEIASVPGSTRDNRTYYNGGTLGGECNTGISFTFETPSTTDDFQERSKAEPMNLLAQITALVGGLYSGIGAMLKAIEILVAERGANVKRFKGMVGRFANAMHEEEEEEFHNQNPGPEHYHLHNGHSHGSPRSPPDPQQQQSSSPQLPCSPSLHLRPHAIVPLPKNYGKSFDVTGGGSSSSITPRMPVFGPLRKNRSQNSMLNASPSSGGGSFSPWAVDNVDAVVPFITTQRQDPSDFVSNNNSNKNNNKSTTTISDNNNNNNNNNTKVDTLSSSTSSPTAPPSPGMQAQQAFPSVYISSQNNVKYSFC